MLQDTPIFRCLKQETTAKETKMQWFITWENRSVFLETNCRTYLKRREQAVVLVAERSSKMRLKVGHGVWQDGASW